MAPRSKNFDSNAPKMAIFLLKNHKNPPVPKSSAPKPLSVIFMSYTDLLITLPYCDVFQAKKDFRLGSCFPTQNHGYMYVKYHFHTEGE